ncbi:MAG: double-strand break repair helicase AddA [Aquisalinus sp.]|nr:double-strand break repair helicase AddA [Aquisalinus sp.]
MTTSSVYEKTVATQRVASDPALSAFVAANAGAGKTKVLTDRVMRLLLTGTPPAKILCITFTKAAAAEMAERLFKRLGAWALMDDAELSAQLAELDQKTERQADELSRARRLFARALETPGGLKIQTIHSFCESLLRRFPLEAGIVPGFTVMEEIDANRLLKNALDTEVLRIWRDGGEASQQFLALGRRMVDQDIRKHTVSLVSHLPLIAKAMSDAGGADQYWSTMATLLGVEEGVSTLELEKRFIDQMDTAWLEAAYSALLAGGKNDNKRAAALRLFLDAEDSEKIDCAKALYLKSDKIEPLKDVSSKQARKHLPGLEEKLKEQQESLLQLADQLRGFEIYQETRFLYGLAESVAGRYAAQKSFRGFLDFDDLIRKTAELFSRTTSAWVMYKLDQGLDHVLLDEAQDTSEVQWQVVMQPLKEFFSGEGAREVSRTAFVVGDGKQSIYSFQGADVELFTRHQGILHDLVTGAGERFEFCDLALSFRSAAPVLDFVDAVFDADKAEGAARGVSEEVSLKHYSNRTGAAGLVELWPLFEKQETKKGNPWDAPVDMPDPDSPETVLAKSISSTIRKWLDTDEILASRGRAIRPGDIMILCKRRGSVFREIVRALIKDNVPTAGSDRLRLQDHIAVMDLMSVVRFILQPADDLSLAEVLKSPLFSLTDEDLFQVVHHRPRGMSLWQSLLKRVKEEPAGKYTTAVSVLQDAISHGERQGPVRLFQFLLESGVPSGWQRFHSRLGAGAREIIEEFLDEAMAYELGNPRTLQGFLQHYEGLQGDLKRESEGGEDLVRVMTVHGSKGLEADIVFIADATYPDSFSVDPWLQLVGPGTAGHTVPQNGYMAFSTSKKRDNAATTAAREYAEMLEAEEYRRQFYVAMTRARDRLYICGKMPGRITKEKLLEKPLAAASWYTLARKGFDTLESGGVTISRHEASWGGDILRYATEQTVIPDTEEKKEVEAEITPPGWLHIPAEPEAAVSRLQPSRLQAIEADQQTVISGKPEPSVYAPIEATGGMLSPYTRGNALHLLLERLPDVPHDLRQETGLMLLRKHYAGLPDNLYTEWLSEVMIVLSDDIFAPVFGAGSKAEVPVTGLLETVRGKEIVSGQIDRLIIGERQISIVDYKTNRPPPKSAEDIPFAYLAQLALYRALLQQTYPDREISCALLWTWQARLMPVPDSLLDHAFVQVTGAST